MRYMQISNEQYGKGGGDKKQEQRTGQGSRGSVFPEVTETVLEIGAVKVLERLFSSTGVNALAVDMMVTS